jgi:Fe-S-cluster containining protein
MKPYRSCVTNLHICKANCCKNGVWVDVEQAKVIEEYVNARPEFSDLHGKTLFAEYDDDTDYFPSGKCIGTALATPDGPCIFLGSDYKCRIYEVRPHFCADYPFMHPLADSNKPVMIDNMFEEDKNCIYHELLSATLKSIEEEKAEEAAKKAEQSSSLP